MARKTTITCDLCQWECKSALSQKEIQVIFQTEQDTWVLVPNYLDMRHVDLCEKCLKRKLNWDVIRARWSQWYNEYSFTRFYK